MLRSAATPIRTSPPLRLAGGGQRAHRSRTSHAHTIRRTPASGGYRHGRIFRGGRSGGRPFFCVVDAGGGSAGKGT